MAVGDGSSSSSSGWLAYSRYTRSVRTARMAAAIASSLDSMDVVCAPEVDEAIGCRRNGSRKVLEAAVREGFMAMVGIPKEFRGRTYRTTYAATEDGGMWLEGYRRFSKAPPPPPSSGRRGARPCTGMTPLSEVSRRRDSMIRERVREARRAMMERIAARKAEDRSLERSRVKARKASRDGFSGKGSSVKVSENKARESKCATSTGE